MPWGNVVIGVRNPVAPPLPVAQSENGGAFTDFHLGRPTKVHPDTCMGESRPWCATTSWAQRPAARIVLTEGVKTYAVGHLSDDEGVTVEADGVFIRPRWARG